MKDLRLALRQLNGARGFAAAVLLTITLGIGATAAMWTIVYDVLLKPLPFAHPEQLVRVEEIVKEWSKTSPTFPVSANHFTFWQRHGHSWNAMALMREGSVPFGWGDHPVQIRILNATAGLFHVLQVHPFLGRSFSEAEAQSGHDHLVVLLFEIWRDRFGSDPKVVGKTIDLDGSPYTVLGVMPSSFLMPPVVQPGTWGNANKQLPLSAITSLSFSRERLQEEMGDLNYYGLARLKPGVTLKAAAADLNHLQAEISNSLKASDKATLGISLASYQDSLVGEDRKPLLILFGAVLALLLVGCINIANLLLTRIVGQQKQLAISAALGADRLELARMAMRELLLLLVAGSAFGLLLASAAIPVLQLYLPSSLSFRGAHGLDWAGVGCAVVACMGAAFFAGALPLLFVFRTDLNKVLQSESRLGSEGRQTRRARSSLVGVEVAVSVALVLLTGLLTGSLFKLLRVDRGFNVEHTVTATINLPNTQYPAEKQRTPALKRLLERLDAAPGLHEAAITSVLPLTGDSWGDFAQPLGDIRPLQQLPIMSFRWISPDYFRAIQLPLLAGRVFTEADWGKHLALISQRTASVVFPNRNPIGQQFKRGDPTEQPFTVIGVVADAHTISLAERDPTLIYTPYWYRCDATANLVVRTTQNEAAVASEIRQALQAVDRNIPIPTIRSMPAILSDSISKQRFIMQLLLFFAGTALCLAGLGVYGIVSYSVAQRGREMGLRLALGAQARHIYGLVLREGLTPVLAGIVCGLLLAFSLSRVVSSLLFNMNEHDPWLATASALTLLLVGVSACLLPARRARFVDPMQALRAE